MVNIWFGLWYGYYHLSILSLLRWQYVLPQLYCAI